MLGGGDAAFGHEHECRSSCQHHRADDVCFAATGSDVLAVGEVPLAVIAGLDRPLGAHGGRQIQCPQAKCAVN